MPRRRTAAESDANTLVNPAKNECPECHKTFTAPGSLTAHLRIHAGVKPFFCQFCQKEFSQSGSLMTHMRIHTNEKPHKCTFCGKAFKQSGTLQTHVRTHTGIKPHVCNYCGKGFTQGGALNAHKRIHTGERPYQCPECQKTFVQSTALIEHRKIHSGERPYSCEVCFMAFVSKARLRVHMKVHANMKPYECSVCGMKFNHSSNCRRHLLTHVRKEVAAIHGTEGSTTDQEVSQQTAVIKRDAVNSKLQQEIHLMAADPPQPRDDLDKVIYVLDHAQNQLVQKDSVEAAIRSVLRQEVKVESVGGGEEAVPQLIQIDGEWYEIQREEEEPLQVEEVTEVSLEELWVKDTPEVSCEVELLPEEEVGNNEVAVEHNYLKRT